MFGTTEAYCIYQGAWLPANSYFSESALCTTCLLVFGIRWHRNVMNEEKTKSPAMAGGVFIALGMLAGAGFGIYIGQPSAGMVIGLITGISAATLIWLLDRARKP